MTPLFPSGTSIDVAPALGVFILVVLGLASLSLLTIAVSGVVRHVVSLATHIAERIAYVRGRPGYDLALLHLGEARGRQQILDEVRMLEHGQLKAHVLAVQQCIARAQLLYNPPAVREAHLEQAMAETNRLLKVVVSLHKAVSDSALPDDLEQTVVEVARSLASVYPACGCRVEVVGTSRPPVSEPVKRALTMVLYNAANNALLHGKPSQLVILLRYAPDALMLEVIDDGRGMFETGRRVDGRGLRDIRQLVESLSGTLIITSAPMQGTTLKALVPLPKAEQKGDIYAALS